MRVLRQQFTVLQEVEVVDVRNGGLLTALSAQPRGARQLSRCLDVISLGKMASEICDLLIVSEQVVHQRLQGRMLMYGVDLIVLADVAPFLLRLRRPTTDGFARLGIDDATGMRRFVLQICLKENMIQYKMK